MLEIARIRENKTEIIERLKVRNLDVNEKVETILRIDEEWRSAKQTLENVLAESNGNAKIIAQLMREGKLDEANAAKARGIQLKEEEKSLVENVNLKANELQDLLYELPNVPNNLVPKGKLDTDNEVVSQAGTIPTVQPFWQPHWELAKKYDIIDFELGVKVTGAGFPFYKGKGARIQRALINFFLDEARDAGYTEIIPPFVVNQASGYGTGQLPDKVGQMYHDAQDDLYLIPTAEVPLTNIYRDVLLKESDFPIKLTGYTPCFRREAGSYGSDVRGLNRLHQFDKVEIVRIEHPDQSYAVLDQMVAYVQGLLTKLELPYRTLR
ncbi:MAG: serine--tRNA ligase, partial [Crocinitomix sp.]|nr:serine--tRNA ligase [Crocinitomix sp.]